MQRLAALRRIELSRVELDPLMQSLPYQNFATRAPPGLRIDARSEEPARELARFLGDFQGRVLIAAESAGRREMLLDILQRRNVRPQLVDSWSAFVAGGAPLGITVSAISTGLVLHASRRSR